MPATSARGAGTRRRKAPANAKSAPAVSIERVSHSEKRKDDPQGNFDGEPRTKKTRKVKEIRQGKVIRDSFTMPAREYELISVLKKRCLGFGVAVKKSELLRAGLAAIHRLSDERLAEAVKAIDNVKTGRPANKTAKQR